MQTYELKLGESFTKIIQTNKNLTIKSMVKLLLHNESVIEKLNKTPPNTLLIYKDISTWGDKRNHIGKILTAIIFILRNKSCDKMDIKLKQAIQIGKKDPLQDVIEQILSNKEEILVPNLDNTKMSVVFRSVKSLHGYSFDVMKSAIQKYIRRGDVEKACLIAAEMDLFRFVNGSSSIVTNFYNRLRIIFYEDIGLANPGLLPILDNLLNKWLGTKAITSYLIKAVSLMASSQHSRYFSHIRAVTKNPPFKENKIPSYGYPSLGADEGDLRETVDNLVWCLENKNEYAWYFANNILSLEKLKQKRGNSTRPGILIFYILQKFMKSSEMLAISENWYKTMKMKEQFLCCIFPMYIYILGVPEEFEMLNIQTNLTTYVQMIETPTVIDDYVFDMHTSLGRKMGRNEADFGVEGSLVAYEKVFNEKIADFYTQGKITVGRTSSESQELSLKARAQLVCSAVRPDTYFAKNRIGQNVVVKGPFINQKDAMTVFDMQTIMRLFPYVNATSITVKYLKPDLFREGPGETGLGCRLKTDPQKGYYFVVMDDLFNLEEYPTKIKSSAKWKETEVVDFEKLFAEHKELGFGAASEMDEDAKVSFVIQLMFRWAFKLGDFATRNFVRVGNKVYNLDVGSVNVGNAIRYSNAEKDILKMTIAKHGKYLRYVLKEWLNNDYAWRIVENRLHFSKQAKNGMEQLLSNLNILI